MAQPREPDIGAMAPEKRWPKGPNFVVGTVGQPLRRQALNFDQQKLDAYS
jgi:hypothetical protein